MKFPRKWRQYLKHYFDQCIKNNYFRAYDGDEKWKCIRESIRQSARRQILRDNEDKHIKKLINRGWIKREVQFCDYVSHGSFKSRIFDKKDHEGFEIFLQLKDIVINKGRLK